MDKKIFSVLVLVAWATVLPAQITREQADTIVKKHLQSELIADSLLYVNVNLPRVGGIEITTSNEETFTAKYACWAYYVNENEFSQCRYLFVKEDNGNLLEVIASNDLRQEDTSQWKKAVDAPEVGIVETWRAASLPWIYPNPTDGQIKVENNGFPISDIRLFDIVGKLLQSKIVNLQSEIEIDVFHLSAGMYFLKVNNQVYKFIKK